MLEKRSAAIGFALGVLCAFGAWAALGRSDVRETTVGIADAQFVADEGAGRIELLVNSCDGAPRASGALVDDRFEVEVLAVERRDSKACLDVVELHFTEFEQIPEELFDLHSGRVVPVQSGN